MGNRKIPASHSGRNDSYLIMLKAFIAISAVMLIPCLGLSKDPDEAIYAAEIEPIVQAHCYDCHGDGMDKGDFAMDKYQSLDAHFKDIAVWYEIWKNVRGNLMPPADKKALSESEKKKVLSFIERVVFKIDAKNPDPGRVTIRRLNREEYRYTIKDLFNVDFDVEDNFPADDTGYGFDTIGDVLSISPLHMEKYLDAANTIAAKAVPVDGPQIVEWWVENKEFKSEQNEKHHMGYIPMDANWTFKSNRWVAHDGEYELSLEFTIKGSNEATEQTGTLNFGYDGKDLVQRKIGWDNSKSLKVKTKARLQAGNKVPFHLTMEPGNPPGEGKNKLIVSIKSIVMRGPLDGSQKDYPWGFRHIFSEGPPPPGQNERDIYRRTILGRLATKIFRQPADAVTVDRLVKLARMVDEQPGKNFEHGIRHAVIAMLASPRFLMRAEIQAEPDNSGKVVLIDEYALASRLSYFLWSSTPDEELMKLAGEKKLRANLRAQIDRMLAHEKSKRFVESFVGQWLQARDVETINIDARVALGIKDLEQARRQFNGRVRSGMREESELFFEHVLKENRPVSELLTANYTFLNEDLANWYGIKDVKGREMRKVELGGDSKRGGILGQGTFHIVTSNPTRTSPVKRGLFVLENMLATPAPPAAPDVPPLEETLKGKNKNLSLREALALHAQDKACAACHARMDPIGLALENYNPAGLWIDQYNGKPILTEGKLMTGESFKNAKELSHILATARVADFHKALAEKMLTYAVGRGVEYYDAPTINQIVDRVGKNQGKLRELIYGVIESAPFQKRRGDGNMLAKIKP